MKSKTGRPPASRSVEILKNVLGITRNEAEALIENGSSLENLKSEEELLEILRQKFPDCDIFNRKDIARQGGYQDVQYFYKTVITDPTSPYHIRFFGPGSLFNATAVTSAQAGKENMKDTIKNRNKVEWEQRSKGWSGKTDPSSGNSR